MTRTMKQEVLLTFILSIICTLSFAQTADEYLERGMDKYVRYQEKGIEKDIPGAIKDFTKALSLLLDSSGIALEKKGTEQDLIVQ